MIANQFADADPGLFTASLLALGFILFVITFIVLAAARFMLLARFRCTGLPRLMSALYSRVARQRNIVPGPPCAYGATALRPDSWLAIILGTLLILEGRGRIVA